MKRAIPLLIVFLFSAGNAHAAFDNYCSSAKTLSLCNASVAMTDEPAVVLTNPGALGFLQSKGIQASLSRLFDLDELSEREFYLAYPFRSFSLGAGFHMFGKADYYQESILAVALAYRIIDRISVGSNLKYMRVSFSPEYDHLSAFSVDLGSAYKVNSKVRLGFAARNVNQPQLAKDSDDIAANFCVGLVVLPFNEATLLLGISYEERYKEQLHLGQEITLVENLPLRFGIQTSPARYALGAGFNFERFVFDYGYSNHSVLGDTHKISFSYRWGRGEARQSLQASNAE
jgi:hypothetical protein